MLQTIYIIKIRLKYFFYSIQITKRKTCDLTCKRNKVFEISIFTSGRIFIRVFISNKQKTKNSRGYINVTTTYKNVIESDKL